jgi:glycosyltransferase involved in cell wall biosynthesis
MLKNNKKVLFLANVPAPYMVDFFNLFGKKTSLTVIFEKSSSTERNSNWTKFNFRNFKGIILNGISTSPDSAFSPKILIYLLKKYDYIFISNPTTPTGILAIFFLKFLNIKFIIESEGAYPNKQRNLKEFIKKIVFSNSWYYFSGNPSNDKYFLNYNPKARIIRYPFSSIMNKDIVPLNHRIGLKQMYREEFKLKNYKRIAIMVGRFVKLKNFDSIIKIWIKMPKDFLLLLIGEGPEISIYKNIIDENKLQNVNIVPFQKKKDLKKYYLLADILIHPTTYDVWGLIVNEAFSNGLPVLSTSNCLSTEVMVKEGYNGNFLDFNKNVFNQVYNLLSSDYLINKYSKNVLKTIKNFTLEKMVSKHLFFINKYSHEKK